MASQPLRITSARVTRGGAEWRGRRRPALRSRRLRVQSDYPRAAAGLGRPVLEASRVVPLRALFPRERCVSDGRGHGGHRWVLRSLAHYARWESEGRRLWGRETR